MINSEIWKDISGYEGLYQISNFGRVKSLDRILPHDVFGKWKIKGKILKLGLNKPNGYLHVTLYDNNKKASIKSIHRLVAEAFVNNINPSLYTQVDHVDCNKLNNRFDNLQWVTPKENTRRAIENGLISYSSSDKDYCKKKVICVETGKVFSSVREAANFIGIAPTNMTRTCKNGWNSRGYHFKYWEEL